jgi:hypothetical protein
MFRFSLDFHDLQNPLTRLITGDNPAFNYYQAD